MLWPGMAFSATALVGVWAAYDRQAAWLRFGLIALGLVLAACVAAVGERGGESARGFLGIGSGIVAATISIYFLLGHDWAQADVTKVAWLQHAGLWLQAHRPSVVLLGALNSNVGGSILAILLPLGLGGLAWAWTQRRWVLIGVSVLTLIPAVAALALSQNRGAWLGLGAAIVAGGYLAWQVRRRRRGVLSAAKSRRIDNVVLIGTALLMVGGFWVAVTQPVLGRLVDNPADIGETAMGRVAIWQSMLPLVGDYFFTGSGLQSTMMVYSSYVLLLHVGFLSYAHNLYLQIAIEQGIPGLLAFIWLIGSAVRTVLNPEADRIPGLSLRIAALASLVVLVVHGMVDAVPYVSLTVPVMFLPIGAAFAFHISPSEAPKFADAAQPSARRGRRIAIAIGMIGIVALGALLLPAFQSMLQTNLGAVAQTRAELSQYRWPDWPIQDALRRSPEVDLAPAIVYYEAALRSDPHNPSANRRLGQIELSRGDYGAAQERLAEAYVSAPWQRATRQLLGESYAISGDTAQAATLWRTVDLDRGQLALRQWWYEHIGETARSGWIAATAELARRED
jgi:O-antigen ligase